MSEDKIPLKDGCDVKVRLEGTEAVPQNREARQERIKCKFILLHPSGKYVHLNAHTKPARPAPHRCPHRVVEQRLWDTMKFLILGLLLLGNACILSYYICKSLDAEQDEDTSTQSMPSSSRYNTVSFTMGKPKSKVKSYYTYDAYPQEKTGDDTKNIEDKIWGEIIEDIAGESSRKSDGTFKPNGVTVLYDHVYWGPQIERALPRGFGRPSTDSWERYVNRSEIVKMELGCGRMQNRLVTFKDGGQACVRYRQNTDQIQGEIFSFYLGKFLNLTNLAPSVIRVVDLKDKLWSGVADEVAAAQWNVNRAVVFTQYIPSLEAATIPEVFKPSGRHLNKYDVLKVVKQGTHIASGSTETDTDSGTSANADKATHFSHINARVNNKTIDKLLELAQWGDLIIFDYLTANLDRIVNNLFNYQWNANIMDGPAHNLAKQTDSGLLIFLDNESGLLHGYRLLKKYDIYHNLMLDNLCVFRKSTIDAIKDMYAHETLSAKIDGMYQDKNDAVTRDVLPPLPDKNKKILHERLGNILSQVKKCKQTFSEKR